MDDEPSGFGESTFILIFYVIRLVLIHLALRILRRWYRRYKVKKRPGLEL